MKNFITILFLFFCSCAIAQTAVFKGHVTDAASCEDIPFATVIIASLNLETHTDFDGNFKFEKLPPGNYTLKIAYVGYQPVESILKIGKKEQAIQQFYIMAYAIILDAGDPLEFPEPLIDPANDSIPKK